VLELTYDPADRRNTLLYRELEDEPIPLADWTGEQAAFRYIGDEAGWTDTWPPEMPVIAASNVITDVGPPQLPELIYLATRSAQEPDLAVALQARRNRVPRDPIFGTPTN
jgi:hypothetical protein